MPMQPSEPDAAPERRQIFVNGRFLTQQVTGVQRYARETLLALDELLTELNYTETQWTLLIPPNAAGLKLSRIAVQIVGRTSGHLWEQVELPWFARRGMLLNFGFTGPIVKTRQVITIHDAAVVRIPQAYRWQFRLYYRLVIGLLVRRVHRVFTVSAFSANEAVACFGVSRRHLHIMTEGWQHLERSTADESIIDRHGLRGKPYILAVSSPTPNKNFGVIPQALALMGPDAPLCVAVGAANASIFKSDGPSGAMLRVGYVSDCELKALYEHASCFVFPSFYEGFGIPALEAMASGCPVVASTAEAVRETCGSAARYFDPSKPSELANQLRKLFNTPGERERMQARGRSRADEFSWRESARLTLAALCEDSHGGH